MTIKPTPDCPEHGVRMRICNNGQGEVFWACSHCIIEAEKATHAERLREAESTARMLSVASLVCVGTGCLLVGFMFADQLYKAFPWAFEWVFRWLGL